MKVAWILRSQLMRRLFALKLEGSLLAACVGIAFAPTASWAQAQNGQINITVTDASTNAPLAYARVLLEGPVMSSELTTQNGKVIFVDTPAGIYSARIAKGGYAPVTTSTFEVVAGQAVDVNVALAVQTGPEVLGTGGRALVSEHFQRQHLPRQPNPQAIDELERRPQQTRGRFGQ